MTPSVKKIQGVEQQMCRTVNRTTMFATGADGHVLSDPQLMVGRLAWHILNRVPKRPTNRELKEFLGIGETAISRFLNGEAAGTPAWYTHAPRIIRRALCGSGEPEPELKAVADRLIDYFFRELPNDGGPPRFFRGVRRHSPHPWSRRELADEINWLARQAGRADPGKRTRLVVCSGRSRFYQGQQDRHEISKATSAVLAAGGEVLFVFKPETHAAESYNHFLQAARPKSMPPLGRLGKLVADGSAPPAAAEYLTPPVQFIFFRSWEGGDKLTTLYALRGRVYELDESREDALAITCNSVETEEFEEWLDGLSGAGARPIWEPGFGPQDGASGANGDVASTLVPAGQPAQKPVPEATPASVKKSAG